MHKIIMSIILFMLVLTGCIKDKDNKIEEEKFIFGTYVKITVYDKNIKEAKNAINNAFDEMTRIDKKFNSKTKNSLIYDLNMSTAKECKLDNEGIYLFENIDKMYKLSNGKYDITIGPLMEMWGFYSNADTPKKLPTEEEISKTIKKVDYGKVSIEGDILRMGSPVEEIDTGSFLKGYAVQKAKEKLKEHGIKSACITSISSIDVISNKPDGTLWRIGIQDPDDVNGMIGIAELSDQAMGVSGDYQTYIEIDGKKYHHILDKNTGYPVADKRMVVVVCKNGFLADLYSTCFFLMPISEVLKYADSIDDLEVLIVDKEKKVLKSKNFKSVKM